ncbi:hydrophobin family protein [Aspergillus vadensis CBS 113365]|uniref:Hydrophobin n=2 Tax=Aspergillus subgen. Circumdati TaxID=2720871 RepID=A0A319BAQ3_ASPVC|nr:conidial hydrophobin Hyp1/RodA [Aspergillus vadensis CBS 113365]PYH70056.1 conidial hydrophobin Hyp1/RodA [Aspergillus vadensis CBS 113365]
MKFSITAAVLAFAATVVAMPGGSPSSVDDNGPGNANGAGNKGNSDVRFPVPGDMTVKQAEDKCGDQAQLSCCNKATYAGDSTNVDSGLLAGTLSNLIGTGSGSEGLGLFQECSKLPLQIPIIGIAVQDIINKQCQQNIACCQSSPSTTDDDLIGLGLPCIALGSLV